MASQVLSEFEIDTTQPFMLRDILPGPAWAPFKVEARSSTFETLTIVRYRECVSESTPEEGNCVKGLVVGICLEAVMALGVFGIWQAWHLIR